MATKTRKATEAEFQAYADYVAPRQREKGALCLKGWYADALVLQKEIDQYCFDNKIVLKRSGVHIIK